MVVERSPLLAVRFWLQAVRFGLQAVRLQATA